MEKKPRNCTSCKASLTNLSGSASFKCPDCGKGEIIRCSHCRKIGTKYACSKCGFSGPN